MQPALEYNSFLFSTILKYVELAKSVNVIPNDSNFSDRVQDIYTKMIEPTNKKIAMFVDENPSYSKLFNIKIIRKLIKPTIMTVPYNVTVKGVILQLISSFEFLPRNKFDKINLNYVELFKAKDLNQSIIKGDPVIKNFEDEIVENIKDYYGISKNITKLNDSSAIDLNTDKNSSNILEI
jgi:DNA-directed RNA polymerase